MKTLLFSLSIFLCFAWIPVLLFFYRAWKLRRNPISLAIALMVTFFIYMNFGTVAFDGVSRQMVEWAMLAMNVICCGIFYFSIWWSERMFARVRKPSVEVRVEDLKKSEG